jgi:hypothetical protein
MVPYTCVGIRGGGGGIEEVGLIDTGSSGIYGGGASCSSHMKQPTCCMGLERTNTHACVTKTTSPNKHTSFEDTVVRIFFYSSFFLMDLLYGAQISRQKDFDFCFVFAKLFDFSKVPR